MVQSHHQAYHQIYFGAAISDHSDAAGAGGPIHHHGQHGSLLGGCSGGMLIISRAKNSPSTPTPPQPPSQIRQGHHLAPNSGAGMSWASPIHTSNFNAHVRVHMNAPCSFLMALGGLEDAPR